MKRALSVLLVGLGLVPAWAASAETPPGTWDMVADPHARDRYQLHLAVTNRLAARETVITLKTLYEGVLIEKVQGDHLTMITRPEGKLKTFAWSEIDPHGLLIHDVGIELKLLPREYRGELIDGAPDEVSIATLTGEVKSFEWSDIESRRTVFKPEKLEDFDAFWGAKLGPALTMLVSADAAHSPDPRLRFDLGRVLQTFERYDEAAAVLESGLAMAPDHPMAQEALFQLAICNDHKNQEEALKTYERYLKVARTPEDRAVAYSNRSEAEMNLGRLEEAIEDSRYAAEIGAGENIAALAQFDLAIELDRYGDGRGAARAADLAINDEQALAEILGVRSGVFFVPEYNTHWYRALAWEALARKSTGHFGLGRERVLRSAASEWSDYVDLADPKDRWLELAKRHRDEAKKRLAQVEAEAAKTKKVPSGLLE